MFRALVTVPRVVQAGGAAAAVGVSSSLTSLAEPLHAVGTSSVRQPLTKSSSRSELPGGWEDEWGFLDNSGREISHPRGDIGTVPRAEEVEEIARELQVTARRHTPVSLQDMDIQEVPERVEVAESSIGQRVVMPFALSVEQSLQGRRLLAHALDVFERDPRVQDAVMSLATDKKVWDAVMNNPAMKALQAEPVAESTQVSVLPLRPTVDGNNTASSASTSYLDKFQQILSKAVDFVKDMFKGLFENQTSVDDKSSEPSPEKSRMEQVIIPMFLAAIIMISVVVKRSS